MSKLTNAQIKCMVDEVASKLSMLSFTLEHEVALRGGWEEAPVDAKLLTDTAATLEDEIATLLTAAAQVRERG